MPIRRRYYELSHAVLLVGRRLQNDGTPAQEFAVKCIGVVYIEIAKIAVVARC